MNKSFVIYWSKVILTILLLSFAVCFFENGMEGIAIEFAKFSLKFYIKALREYNPLED